MRHLHVTAARLWAVASLVALAVVILGTGIGTLSRVIGTNRFTWSYELVGIAFVWVTALGAVMAERAGENVSIELLNDRLSPRGRLWLGLLRRTLVSVIAIVLLYSTWAMLQRSAFTPTPVMRLPNWVQHIAIGVMAAGLVLVQIAQTASDFRKNEK